MHDQRPSTGSHFKIASVSFTVVAVLGSAIFVIVWGFFHDWGASQWGPAASWMSALFAIFTVTVAVVQTALTRRDAREERMQRHEERQERRRTEDVRAIRLVTEALDVVYIDTRRFLRERAELMEEGETPETARAFDQAFDRWLTAITSAGAKVEAAILDLNNDDLYRLGTKAAAELDELQRCLYEPADTSPDYERFKVLHEQSFDTKRQLKNAASRLFRTPPNTSA